MNIQTFNISYRAVLLISAISLLFAMFSGCNGQKKLVRDIQQSRQKRYEALVRLNGQEEKSDWQVLSGPLNINECIELALRYNKDVQAAKLKLLEAKGEMIGAVSTALPKADFTGSAMRNDNSSIFGSQKETYELQLLVRQPLYLGGLIGTALDAARVFTYQKQQELRQTIQIVQLEVRQKYNAALLTEELVEVSIQEQRDATKLLGDTQIQLRHGVATRYDVLRAEVRLNAVEARLIRQQNEAQIALTRLLDVLGVSQGSQAKLTDKLTYEPIEAASSQCLEIAMKQRPDLLIGEAMVRLMKDNVAAEKAGNRPKVYLQGMYMRGYPGFAASFPSFGGNEEDGGDGFLNFDNKKIWERTMSGGIVVEWPFFNGLATHGRVIKAKALHQQQQVTLRKLEQQCQLEITQALLNLQSSEKFVLSQQGNVTNAEEALRLAQVGFREGTISSLDVISSELALALARSNYHQAVYDYRLARLSLNAALGTLGEQPIPQKTEVTEK
ncbi:MAG: TolC family protein [Sedimentisphaerales bacterium]|nr:TolC family protein [Sedimentisphaerales bacterium]